MVGQQHNDRYVEGARLQAVVLIPSWELVGASAFKLDSTSVKALIQGHRVGNNILPIVRVCRLAALTAAPETDTF